MKKKVLISILLFISILSLVACSGKDTDKEDKVELNEKSITNLAKKHFGGYGEFKEKGKIELVEVNDKKVSITYYVEKGTTSDLEASKFGLNSVNVLKEIYTNTNAEEVTIIKQGTYLDDKGNPSKNNIITLATSKDSVADVNWDNFKDIAGSNFRELQNIATNFIIDPIFEKDLSQ